MRVSSICQNKLIVKNNHKKQKSSQNNNQNYKNFELRTNPSHYPINFGAMKKNQFSGIDLAVIEKFKKDNCLDYTPAQIVISTGAKSSLYHAICDL